MGNNMSLGYDEEDEDLQVKPKFSLVSALV